MDLFPTIHNRNSCPSEHNNFDDDSSTYLLYDGHFCDTIIPENIYLSSNNIPERKYFILSSLHMGGEKYRI